MELRWRLFPMKQLCQVYFLVHGLTVAPKLHELCCNHGFSHEGQLLFFREPCPSLLEGKHLDTVLRALGRIAKRRDGEFVVRLALAAGVELRGTTLGSSSVAKLGQVHGTVLHAREIDEGLEERPPAMRQRPSEGRSVELPRAPHTSIPLRK